MMEEFTTQKKQVAGDLLDEILSMIQSFAPPNAPDPMIEGTLLIKLLNSNFERLDPNGDGISRKELSVALARPADFSTDEYAMLYLVAKYFDTIAELSDDEPGKRDSVITPMDRDILGQFIIYSKMSVAELSEWMRLDKDKRVEDGVPPLS
jgi:hypothetical protein